MKKKDTTAVMAQPLEQGALLAQIAAPMVAAGMSDEDSLKRASTLLEKARLFAKTAEGEAWAKAQFEENVTDLAGIKKAMGLTDDRVIRKWICAAIGKEEGEAVFARAKTGEKAFTQKHWAFMIIARNAVRKGKSTVFTGSIPNVFEKIP